MIESPCTRLHTCLHI